MCTNERYLPCHRSAPPDIACVSSDLANTLSSSLIEVRPERNVQMHVRQQYHKRNKHPTLRDKIAALLAENVHHHQATNQRGA
jgi:hypothetical protein